ncbi:HI1506-related protein [Gilliamella sp. CG16]|uniref:HI1506-related protein n=1 Tax=Gilliamella sp. CG16 TaxID=3351503 RepID=UPI0039868A87
MRSISSVVGIKVVNTRHDGYRRAGLTLSRGENKFTNLTVEQINALQTDSALTVTIIEGGDINEIFDDAGRPATDATGNSTGLESRGASGKTAGAAEDSGGADEDDAKIPSISQSYIELSQAVVVALAESDEAVYFNSDGSPRITKWREVTGNVELTKGDVIEAIEMFETAKSGE